MAYQSKNLSVLAYANGFTMWHFVSAEDTLGAITAPQYFNSGNAPDMLRVNDQIIINATDGNKVVFVTTCANGSVEVA